MKISDRVKELLQWSGAILTLFMVIGAFFAFFGIDVQSPAQRLQTHIQAEKEFHDTTSKNIAELDKHEEDNEVLLQSMVRGECLENKRENLIRQGLIQKCKELGVER